MDLALYEIANKYQEAYDDIDRMLENGEITEEQATDVLDGIEGSLAQKAKNITAYSLNLESSAEAIEEAAKKMMARAKVLRNRSKSMKDYLLFNMNRCGIKHVHHPEFDIKVVKNPPKLNENIDIDKVPFIYKKIKETVSLDKAAIKDAIKKGIKVDGCYLVDSDRVSIK